MNILIKLKEKIVYIVQFVIQYFNNTLLKFSFRKKLIIISGLIIIVLILFVGAKKIFFKPKVKEKEETLTKVKVTRISKGDFSQKYAVMGTIKGAVENDLRFEVEGVILKYNYKEGARIDKGKVIAYLDTKDAMAKVSYSKSRFESEKAAYFSGQQRLKVYEELFKLKAISESKLIETKYEVEALRQRMETALAELELAQSNLSKTNLYSPSNGILAEIVVQPGEFVTPQDVVAKFVSIGDAKFEVEIPEKDVGQIKIGMKTKVFCDAYPDKEFTGVVSEIAPTVKEKTRTVVVKISLPNEEGLLRSGMFARGDILLSETSNTIAVLSDSIVSLGEGTKLLPLLKPIPEKQNQGIVELRHIKTGDTIGKLTIVTDGVEEGELYISETTGELSDGLLVEYIIEQEQSPNPTLNQ